MIVPEFYQNDATPERLSDAVLKQLNDEAHRKELVERFTVMHESLLKDTAALSAQAVLDVMKGNNKAGI